MALLGVIGYTLSRGHGVWDLICQVKVKNIKLLKELKQFGQSITFNRLNSTYSTIKALQNLNELEEILIPIADENGIGYRINKEKNMIEPFQMIIDC